MFQRLLSARFHISSSRIRKRVDVIVEFIHVLRLSHFSLSPVRIWPECDERLLVLLCVYRAYVSLSPVRIWPECDERLLVLRGMRVTRLACSSSWVRAERDEHCKLLLCLLFVDGCNRQPELQDVI